MSGRRDRIALGALATLGALSIVGHGVLARSRGWSGAEDLRAFLVTLAVLFVLYGAALVVCARRSWSGHGPAVVILFVAAACRLALLPAGTDGWSSVASDLVQRDEEPVYSTYLLYDHDVWRYLWDGRVTLAGVDPYRFSPGWIENAADDGDPRFAWALDEPWATITTRIGYADYRTIYPPLAQLAFAASTAVVPGSVAAWKLLLLLADLATCVLLIDLGRRTLDRPAVAVIYAWNPLVTKELIGSGHVDALAILALVCVVWALERGRDGLALGALAAAVLVKLTPLLVAPVVLCHTAPRRWWLLPALGVAIWAPWLGSLPIVVDSLRAFARDWAFNAGPWTVALAASRALGVDGRGVADLLSLALGGAVIAWVSWRARDADTAGVATAMGWILGAWVLLSSTVMPWYLLWALPLLAFDRRGRIAWPIVTAASVLSYGVYVDGVERVAWLAVEYVVVIAAVGWAAISCRARAGP